MPSERAPQERVWMAFPPRGASMTATAADAHEARVAWATVAHAIAAFEPVTMVVDPADRDIVRDYLATEIDVLHAPLDDAWMRDIGPTFVRDDAGRLGAVDWVFNGWGQQDWARWDNDARIGAAVAEWSGAQRISSELVNEGGAIQTDGEGAVLVTETVQLDPLRNPGLDKTAVEAELRRTIGADRVIWLPRGLTRDSEKFGTKGHADLLAALPSPGVALVHAQRDPAHPDHLVSKEVIEALSAPTGGAPLAIVELPAPTVLRDEEGWVDYSYINHLVVNGGVIACGFDDPHDADARAILADVYPGREVVTVDARAIFARGGGIHCITQQQPAQQLVRAGMRPSRAALVELNVQPRRVHG